MKIRLSELKKIIRETVAAAGFTAPAGDTEGFDFWLSKAEDPEAFKVAHGRLVGLGAGNIPIGQLLELPRWFDAGADRGDGRLDGAYDQLTRTLATMGHVDALVTAFGKEKEGTV